MLAKKEIINSIEKISEVVRKYELGSMLGNDIKELCEDINRYKTKVVVVGKFSAGKSALLNTLLGRYVLSEDQGPETALATELVFDEEEYVELIDSDNGIQRCELVDVEDKVIDDFNYCIYHLNSKYLNKHNDITLVDMPGFDSSVERHNKAILRYIDEASAYFLVIDVEDGTIQKSAIDFMTEVKHYNSNMMIILTKCDKKIDSDIAMIRDEVAAIATDIFNEEVPVITVSRFDDNLDDKIDLLIEKFDINDIFKQKFEPRLENIVNKLKLSLTTMKENYVYDSSEIDEKIKENIEGINEYKKHIDNEKKKVHNKLYNEDLPNIMNEIGYQLNLHNNEIADAALQGQEIFKHKITEITRPILVETLKERVSDSMNGMFNNIDIDVNDNDSLVDPEKIKDFGERLQKFIDGQSNKSIVVHSDDKVDNKKGDTGNIRKLLTAIAVVTDYVAPIVELIIIFAPEICDMINGLLRKWQREQLREKIKYEVIPEIIRRMEPMVEEAIISLENDIISEFDSKVEEYKNIKNNILEKLKVQSSSDREVIEKKVKDIDLDLGILDTI